MNKPINLNLKVIKTLNLASIFLLYVTFFSLPEAYSQDMVTKSNEPIYVVDMQKVIMQSIPGKAASANMQEEIKKKQVVLEKQKLEIDKLRQDLEKQSSLLSESALESKKETLIKKSRDLERSVQDQKEEISIKNKAEMEKIVELINTAIKELSIKNNYRMVLERDMRVVVYVNNKYDITDEVIKLVNEKHVGV